MNKKCTQFSVLKEHLSAILVSLSFLIGIICGIVYYVYEISYSKKIDYEANRSSIEYIAEDVLNTRKIDLSNLDRKYEYVLDVQYDTFRDDDMVKLKISKSLFKSLVDNISLDAVLEITHDGKFKSISYTPNSEKDFQSSIRYTVIGSSIATCFAAFFICFVLIELALFIYHFVKYKNLTKISL